MSAQDRAAGETSFKKCMVCHEIGEHAKRRTADRSDRKPLPIGGFLLVDVE
jgi:hypothetical protein